MKHIWMERSLGLRIRVRLSIGKGISIVYVINVPGIVRRSRAWIKGVASGECNDFFVWSVGLVPALKSAKHGGEGIGYTVVLKTSISTGESWLDW
jgi:hypothetical protein